MEIKTTNYKSCDVVMMSGRIDSDTSPQLTEAFKALTDDGKFHLVFDMGKVEFISSSGVWVLMETQKECKKRKRGELVIANVNEKIQHSLDLAGLKHFFKIFDNVTDGVGNF